MNNKDFAIGVLTVTATVLLTAVLLLAVLAPRPAQAFGLLDEGLGYTLYTIRTAETIEQVHVINHAAGLLNAYNFDINARTLQGVQQIPLPPVTPTQTPAVIPAPTGTGSPSRR